MLMIAATGGRFRRSNSSNSSNSNQQQQQQQRQQPQRNRACVQLEAQLAAFDRGANDPARVEQIRRLEAIAKQQAELDRNDPPPRSGSAAKAASSFRAGRPGAGRSTRKIQTQRTNLDRAEASLQQLQGVNAPGARKPAPRH